MAYISLIGRFIKFSFGNSNSNTIYGSDYYDDRMYGGGGNDTFYSSLGLNYFNGGTGSDTVNYSGSSSAVDVRLYRGTGTGGDAQGDTYYGIENLVGSTYNDNLHGNFASNWLYGAQGADTLYGYSGNDYLYGGSDNDRLYGGRDVDYLHGGEGNDRMYGGSGDDKLAAAFGNNYVNGGSGSDTVVYNSYNEYSTVGVFVDLATGVTEKIIDGEFVFDTLVSIENISGSHYADVLLGDEGNNEINGYYGTDIINAGGGNDTLTGGGHADIFIFANNDDDEDGPDFNHGNDVIRDFELGIDKINLRDTEVEDFDDLLNGGDRHMDQVGNDTVIYTIDGHEGDSITLEGIDLDDLQASDFIF